MATDEHEKRRAKDDRDGWKRVSVTSGSLGAGLGVAGGLVVAVGAPVLVIPLGLAGLAALGLRWNADLKLVGADRRVEDPPREDFREVTTAPLVLPYRDAFGRSDFERTVARFARLTVETVSFESAMVTAHERELGAVLFGADDEAVERARERREFRVSAGWSNIELASETRQLARWLAEVLGPAEFERRAADWTIGRMLEAAEGRDLLTLATAAFPDAVATFEAAGYPRSTLRGAGFVGEGESLADVARNLPRDLEAAADACEAYGYALADGEPPPRRRARLTPPAGPSRGPGSALTAGQRRLAAAFDRGSRAVVDAVNDLRRRL